jgi:cell division protein FtsB
MRNFQEKNKFKNFMRSKSVLVLLTLVVLIFSWKVVGLAGKLEDTYKNKKIEEQKISDLEDRKAKLTSDINKLGTDKGKEEVIRNNFGMVKDGEGEIVIVDDKNQTQVAPEPQKGFFSWLKNLFNSR